MNLEQFSTIEYQVGGSLTANHPTYIERQADRELYQSLLDGQFCYILTSRQMGKSSLRLRTRHCIESTGQGKCASVDMTRIGSEQITPNQWYQGIAFDLLRNFKLVRQIDLTEWWSQKGDISPVQKLGQLVEEILLKQVESDRLFIFVDEIDSVQSLPFPCDDFFAFIRFCYNQRAENSLYRRLTWALFGVASPGELIADRKRTPFNIGKAISLPGFTLSEAQPLLEGLKGLCDNPEELLAAILDWTSGQPFLTQKICDRIQKTARNMTIDPGTERNCVDWLTRSQIIEDWDIYDEPEHLRTIQNFIFQNSDRTARLLGIYQQILATETGFSPADTDDLTPLLLSGLVRRQGNTFFVRNRIYQEVFDSAWIERQLTNLRPYDAALKAWIASNYQDETQLLQQQDLRKAQAWMQGKSLSDLDYQFLAASQSHDRRRRERRIVEILAVLNYRSGKLPTYLQEIARSVSELIELDWSVVTLCHNNEERILASSLDIGAAADEVYGLHGTLTGTVFATGCPLVVEDTIDCTDYGNAPEGYRAYLGVPLRISTGEIIGTICSFNHNPRKFDEEEVKLISIFADRGASAIENYQLYQQLQEMNETLRSQLKKRDRNPFRRLLRWLQGIMKTR